MMALRLSFLACFTGQNSKKLSRSYVRLGKQNYFANVQVLANFTTILGRDLINHINYSGFVKLVLKFSRIFSLFP